MERETLVYRASKPSFASEACLTVQFPHIECHACVDACPVEAISVSGDELEVSSACHVCGRCAPACPTGAIAVESATMSGLSSKGKPGQPIYVDCHRAPADDANRLRVVARCLGALSVNDLLRLRIEAGDAPIHVIDRGWCTECPAGGSGEHPAAAALAAVQRLFEQLGMPRDLAPAPIRSSIVVSPLNFSSVDDATTKISRRRFFRRIVEAPVPTEPTNDGTRVTASFRRGTHKIRARERQTRFALVQSIADRSQLASSNAWLPGVTLGTECVDHRVCVAVCPTGALRIAHEDTDAALVFDPTSCVECGACAANCPEKAIHVAPGTAAPGLSPLQRLKAITTRECVDCGDSFADVGGDEVCPSCMRSKALFADLAEPRSVPRAIGPRGDTRRETSNFIDRG